MKKTLKVLTCFLFLLTIQSVFCQADEMPPQLRELEITFQMPWGSSASNVDVTLEGVESSNKNEIGFIEQKKADDTGKVFFKLPPLYTKFKVDARYSDNQYSPYVKMDIVTPLDQTKITLTIPLRAPHFPYPNKETASK